MDNRVIDLTGFQYTGTDVIDRLETAFEGFIKDPNLGLEIDTVWFRQHVLSALMNGTELVEIVRGLNRFAQGSGYTVRGADNVRAA